MNSHTAWYVSRATGMVAFVLLALSVDLGLVLSTRLLGRKQSPAWLLDMHRMVSGLAVIFVGIHLLGLLADSYVEFTLLDLLIPFSSDWQPLGVAAGIVAFWLLLAVELSSLARKKLSNRVWRSIHMLSWLLFWLSALHMAVGTDAALLVWRVVALAAIGSVMFMSLVRFLSPRAKRDVRPSAAPSRATAPRGTAGSTS